MAPDRDIAEEQRVSAALARLTENEKACLRRRLLPQTAKEMAIDLGISPHAVEKRLKMARAKLGVTSSLAAARLLGTQEADRLRGARYECVVPRPSDLSGEASQSQDVIVPATDMCRERHTPGGPMSFLLAVLVAVLPQASAPLPAPAAADAATPLPTPSGDEPIEDIVFRPASADEVRAFVRDSFRTMDKDGSGYIERAEAPENGLYDAKGALTPVRGRIGRAMSIAQADTDDDGRISEAEFVASRLPIFLGRGVPTNWRGEAMAAAAAAPSAAKPVVAP